MQTQPDLPQSSQPSPQAQGCSSWIGLAIVGLLAFFGTLVAQVVIYGIEQAVFEGSLPVPDTRWVAALVYALSLVIPLGLLAYATRGHTRAVFRTWFLAALFALVLVPAHLVWLTDAPLIAAVQIAGMLIFFIALRIWLGSRTDTGPLRPLTGRGLFAAIFWGLLLAFPWLRWGALGSPLDGALSLLVAFLLAVCASLILNGSLLVRDRADPYPPSRLSGDAWVFLVALAIMVTGLGLNGQQWLLLLVLMPLSWAAVVLSVYARGQVGSNWLVPAALLTLAAFWPLAFLDPDELALVTSSGTGELNEWALRMAFLTLALGIIVSLAVYLLRRIFYTPGKARTIFGGLAAAALLVGGLLYGFLGRPGFYGEHLFVVLKDQADVSAAAKIPDYNQRRSSVYFTLVRHADTTQAGMRAQLDQFGVEYKPYYLVNAVEVWGGPLVRLWLSARPEVDRILDNPELRPLPQPVPESTGNEQLPASRPLWNQSLIGADRVWKELDVTGKGVIVGQSDSGVEGSHPELLASYRGQGSQNDYNWLDPWNGSRQPVDIGGHGTHTLGSILGKNVGIAPGATWIGCVNLARNLGNPAYYLDCMQFMLAPFPQTGNALKDGDPTKGAMVLNNSWGCPEVEGCDPNTFLPAVRALRAAGIFVVVSAGNSGYRGCGSVSDPPAIYGDVYSVGAVDSQGQKADFSSMGPVTADESERVKPDIAAPGEGVLSSYPGSSYYTASGTSMAGPHVVGVVALMWSANPKLIGNIDRTVQILDQTARPYRGPMPECASGQGIPNNVVGYGVVDAYAAVQMALESK